MVKPTRRSSGDPSRQNHSASLRSSLRFGRNTPGPVLPVGAPPSRALSGGRLAPTGRTGRSRRSPGFHHRLLTACGETLKAALRGAQRRGGGVWGGVSPLHERRWSESRSDSHHQPGVKAPRTHTNRQIRRAGRPGARAGCFHHGLLTLHSFRPGFPVSPRLRMTRPT